MSTIQVPSYSFHHPQLGQIRGRLVTDDRYDQVVQFRSIPYATIPERFSSSLLLHSLPDHFDAREKGDFTQYAAACPQPGGLSDERFESYGGSLQDDQQITFNEFTCLTVSLSLPLAALDGKISKPLPVLVYVHGGALAEGVAHVDGLHESTKMAGFSAQENMPVIIVNIGYRLNWLGFMTCRDLIDEVESGSSKAANPEGVFNVGFYDQRKAFQWIQNQIEGFGGDPANVTAFGESAGSVSLVYHLCSTEPLFRRAILQSGSLFGNSTMEENDGRYRQLLKSLKIEEETAKDRLAKLREVPIENLVAQPSFNMFPYFGVETQHMFPTGIPTYSAQFEMVKRCPWIDALIIGDDQFEGSCFKTLVRAGKPGPFVNMMRNVFGSGPLVDEVLSEYGIAIDGKMDANLFWSNLMILVGDVYFGEPAQRFSNLLGASTDETGEQKKPTRSIPKIYRYRFCLTNPFPGSDISYVSGHHYVEILFIFLTLLKRYPQRRNKFLERQAYETARRWIAFANGQAPWDEYKLPTADGHEGKIAICDDREGWTVRTRAEDERISKDDPWGERRYKGLELLGRLIDQVHEKSGPEGVNAARRNVPLVTSYM